MKIMNLKIHNSILFLQNPVGAGRYDVQRWEEAQHKDGHCSVFNSKVKRKPTNRDAMMK